jgi:hypothetical protein
MTYNEPKILMAFHIPSLLNNPSGREIAEEA